MTIALVTNHDGCALEEAAPVELLPATQPHAVLDDVSCHVGLLCLLQLMPVPPGEGERKILEAQRRVAEEQDVGVSARSTRWRSRVHFVDFGCTVLEIAALGPLRETFLI